MIVDFLEGDPDQPIVTGRVYKQEQMPPYGLSANKAQTGTKRRSSPGGGANFNEIRFEAKPGAELMFDPWPSQMFARHLQCGWMRLRI